MQIGGGAHRGTAYLCWICCPERQRPAGWDARSGLQSLQAPAADLMTLACWIVAIVALLVSAGHSNACCTTFLSGVLPGC